METAIPNGGTHGGGVYAARLLSEIFHLSFRCDASHHKRADRAPQFQIETSPSSRDANPTGFGSPRVLGGGQQSRV